LQCVPYEHNPKRAILALSWVFSIFVNMKNKIAIVLLLFLSCNLFSQSGQSVDSSVVTESKITDSSTSVGSKDDGFFKTSLAPPKETPTGDKKIEKPTIGLGIGLLSYYGGIYGFQSPLTSRIGYDITVSQRMTKSLRVNFNFLFGQLGDNNRSVIPADNANFQSQLNAGGVSLVYDFGNLLPNERTATPFVSLGIESFEFLSKTDTYGNNGNQYFYWTDGSMRNIAQNAPNAGSAVIIQRNYTYESDLRQSTLQSLSRYPEFSFAIPVGAGFLFKINDYITFRVSSTLHCSFTKYIDGDIVSHEQKILFMKTSGDFFMMNSFGINYSFGVKAKTMIPETEEINVKEVDFYVLDMEDRDKDGVPDIKDKCQGTPIGIAVDTSGCPLDDDNDGIPNYKDAEIHSRKGAIVNNQGVTLTDSLIAAMHRRYMGTTGEYAVVEELQANGTPRENEEFVVSLGTYEKGVPTDLLTKFLSIPDIEGVKLSENSSMYLAGRYTNIEDAEKRKEQLLAAGIPNAKVIYKENNSYRDVQSSDIIAKANKKQDIITKKDIVTNNVPPVKKEEVIVPEKIAASKESIDTVKNTTTAIEKNEVPVVKETITPLKNTDTVKNETKVAEKTEVPVVKETIVPTNEKDTVKGSTIASNTITEKETTAVAPVKNVPVTETTKETLTKSAEKESDVVFRVQLGAYSKPLSKYVFLGVQDLIEITTENGLYKYTSKAFTSMEDAAGFRVKMLLNGYEGAFITAYKDGKRISLNTAGATFIEPKKEVVIADTTKINVVNKQLVTFKVQVGIYKDAPPEEKLKIFEQMKNVVSEKTVTGLTRYVIGNFTEFVKAEEFRYEIIKKYGVSDPFVIALFNNEYITVQEALELLR